MSKIYKVWIFQRNNSLSASYLVLTDNQNNAIEIAKTYFQRKYNLTTREEKLDTIVNHCEVQTSILFEA